MLVEVSCDKFMENGKQRPPIIFHEGLNVIVGNNEGGNSIGKSTFLMILDFVFGGSDYIKELTAVKNNIHDHTIKFQFVFNGRNFYFSRNTTTPNTIEKCDASYHPLGESYNLDEYNKFLLSSYGISPSYGSFRSIVSRFLRIYNRSCMDEKRPLSIKNEKSENSLRALFSLLGLEQMLSPYETADNEAKEEWDYLQKASKKGDKPIVKTRKERALLQSELDNLNSEISSINEGLLTADSIRLEVAASIDRRLSNLLSRRSKLKTKIKNLESIEESDAEAVSSDLKKLLYFFPNAETSKIEEIENFHTQIKRILGEQIYDEQTQYQKQLEIINSEITKTREELNINSTGNFRITSVANAEEMDRIINLTKERDRIKNVLENTDNLNQAIQTKKESETTLKNKRIELSKDYISQINTRMDEINKIVTSPKITNPPTLHLTEDGKNYIFETPQDQGRGTKYKGMAIFDLTILENTVLPILIHDSDLLQPVELNPVDGIVREYIKSRKQIFIAVDKLSSFHSETKDLLMSRMVLELYPGGGELFGRAWNKPDNQ